ncbi:MAG TPA: hypothetical protein VHO69_08420 [Phototrophicaceae bacterium]|nr:hypothetical protein [Phototrophicaceae bacterium]
MAQKTVSRTPMDEIAPHLLQFLQDKVNSFVKWDLVRFFHDNPHAADTAENIARYTGRDARTIADELQGLVEVGVLEQNTVSGLLIYALASDAEMRGLINEFVLACDDRQFRVKAIYHVIKAMR